MANCKELKLISRARLRSAEILIDAKDWDGAVYMMGHVLECALKSSACKSLHLSNYPQNRKTDSHFMTHNFDQLLVLSGLTDIFPFSQPDWSGFTQEFVGDWPAMRYDLNHQQSFDELKTKKLYYNIKNILAIINKKRRW